MVRAAQPPLLGEPPRLRGLSAQVGPPDRQPRVGVGLGRGALDVQNHDGEGGLGLLGVGGRAAALVLQLAGGSHAPQLGTVSGSFVGQDDSVAGADVEDELLAFHVEGVYRAVPANRSKLDDLAKKKFYTSLLI